VVLPFLSSVLAIEQAIIDTSSNTTAVADSQIKKTQLQASVSGWQSLLNRNSQLMVNASTGKLSSYAVTHLVAEALLQDDNGNDNVKYINGSNAPDANKLRAISAISFGGAGSMISYTETLTNSSFDSESDTTTKLAQATLALENTISPGGFGALRAFALTLTTQLDISFASEKTFEATRTRGFSLGDSDQGDVFDVQVFTDPVFGSYVFNTMSGQSRCV
jgi:hypothetical protein